MMKDVVVHGGGVKDTGRGYRRLLHGEDHLRLLPPSANWYCSKICDWGRSDVFGLLFAFGAKNSVFIYQVTTTSDANEDDASEAAAASGSKVKVSFFAQLVRGKRDRRVTAVQFLTDTTGELRLVCGGEDGSVQIWDVASLVMIEQHRKHKAEVMAVTVSSTLDANFVVAGDRQGRISAWERDAGKVFIFVPVSGDAVHSMASSPHDKALIAVGYRSGVLCLVDAAKGTVRHRLAGHDQEVQCVAWKSTVRNNPVAGEIEEDSGESKFSDREAWLASSSRDKTIKVWKVIPSAVEEPVLDQVLRLPTGQQGMSFTQTKQLWLPVAWSFNGTETPGTLGKHCLWSGSFDGSLFRWQWNVAKAVASVQKGKNVRASCKFVVVKGGHNRMLFSIVMVPSQRSAPAEDEAVSMLTVSLDRELRLWKERMPLKSLAPATCVEKLTGLGGHTYSVSYNTTTEVVAAGIGDQTIRLWNLDTEAGSVKSDYECDLLWKGLQSKVTCVRWHPFQHSLLAYGMEDGRIGVYDTQTKKYYHFRTSHGHEVQRLQWILFRPKEVDDMNDGDNAFLESIKQLEAAQAEGQSLEEALISQEGKTSKSRDGNDVKVLLWSCDTGGHLLESNADAFDKKSREIMRDSVDFEWNEQCELVAVGRSNGVVEVLTLDDGADNSNALYRFHEHLDSVTCLAWSKGANTSLLASGGKDGKIFVYCFGNSSEYGAVLSNSAEGTQYGILCSVAAHSSKVTNLRWCSDIDSGLLASSSADGTVQVWDTPPLQRKAHFNHHVGRVLSMDWVSPFTLVTGGEDQTLRFWDYREQQNEPSPKVKKHSKVKQPQEVETPAASSASVETDAVETLKTDTLHELSPAENCTDHTPTKNKPKKKSMVVFHPHTNLTAIEIASTCCRVAGVKQQPTGQMSGMDANKSVATLLFHNDCASLRDFFTSESQRFRDERDWKGLANTLLLQGDIIEALRIVAKEGALTPTWLSYAPMAGVDVWREMTNLYAHQLEAHGDKKAAAFHFLSIAKVRSAVACLTSGEAYDEALALIRSRLGPNDPLLHDTLWKYADFLTKRCRHGEAALALLNIGSVKAKARAAHGLVNTGDMICVKAALDVLQAEARRETSRDGTDDGNGDKDELSFPASFFISIAGCALAQEHFDVAETAGLLLQSRLTGISSPASHNLTLCLLGILKAIAEHQLPSYELDEDNGEVVVNRVDKLLQSHAPDSVRDFFGLLLNRQKKNTDDAADSLYTGVVDACALVNIQERKLSNQGLVARADNFWFQVLTACRRSGYWFDAKGEIRVQEAQDLLIEANCFGDIEKAVAASSHQATDTAIASLLRLAQILLRFVIDAMSTSLIGALEHIREVFLFLAQGEITNGTASPSEDVSNHSAFRVGAMLLLYPCSFATPQELPQCGELAEEQLDTLVLWSSILISQCRIVLAASVSIAEKSTADCERNLVSLLHLLRVWFVDDEKAAGCMDTGLQSQGQVLMNEVLVAVHQLPDGPGTRSEQVQAEEQGEIDEETNGGLSRKQALINDANDLRSRLTWSDNVVEQ